MGTIPAQLGSNLKDYVYEPLRDGEIRLFHMDSSKTLSAQITGTLQAMPLSDEPPLRYYTALSYAWGPSFADGSHLTDYIVCDGRRLRVTPILKRAMQRIRELEAVQPFEPPSNDCDISLASRTDLLALWIDALCINQEDLIERSCHVKAMARIFWKSAELIIWLGELSPDPLGEAQHHLLCFHESDAKRGRLLCPRCQSEQLIPPSLRRNEGAVLMGDQRDTSPTGNPASLITDGTAFASILTRRWFHRRWVIQEVRQAPSSSTYILLGDVVCHKSEFLAISKQIGADSRPIDSMRTNAGGPSALFYHDQSECSDPRDYIYALLSEFTPSERVQMDVNYDQDVRTVYLNLVKRTALGISARMDETLAAKKVMAPWPEEYRYKTLIAYLVVASCKKDASSQSLTTETWVPDWRLDPLVRVQRPQSYCRKCYGTITCRSLGFWYCCKVAR